MWFKNLVFYRLPADWSLSPPDLEDRLAGRCLQACGPFDMTTKGWMPVLQGGRLLHSVGHHHMLALGINEKLLPASIVRQVAEERAAIQAQEQGFPVGRKQMRDLRGRVADEFRSKALTRRRVIRAWIDAEAGWFGVDVSSLQRAASMLETLAETLGSFVPVPLETEQSPHAAMASWLLRGEAPGRFSIDDELELQAANQTKSMVRYSRHPLDGMEIQAHLHGGKYPVRLGLTWSDRVAFVLTDKLQIKRLEFLTMNKDADDADQVDPAEQFDIDFAVMAGELGGMLKDLSSVLVQGSTHATAWSDRSKVA